MANTEETIQSTPQRDEENFKALEEALYTRLRQTLEPRINALFEARAGYFLPEYYDRVVTSEVRRLETALEHNGRRIDELRSYMDQRFDEFRSYVDHRFDEFRSYVDRRFDELRSYVDQRFDELRSYVDQRFNDIDKRFEQIDRRFDKIDDRFDALDDRISETHRIVRNWMVIGFAFLGLLFTIIQLFLTP
jgi:chaperonin cofactor prefoldin